MQSVRHQGACSLVRDEGAGGRREGQCPRGKWVMFMKGLLLGMAPSAESWHGVDFSLLFMILASPAPSDQWLIESESRVGFGCRLAERRSGVGWH